MADLDADPNQGSLDGEPGITNKEKLADSTTQDSSSSDGKNGDTNGVVSSSTSSFGSSQSPSGVTSTQTVSSPIIPPSRLTFCRPSSSLTGFSAATSNPILGASKMIQNPFAPKGSLKSDMVSSASITTQSSEGIIAPSRFGLSRQPDSTNFKSASFKSSPFLFQSQFESRPQNMHSLIKPATLPDPTNKNSPEKEQTEKLDADSSSSKPSSETSKEAASFDSATSRLGGVEAGNISSTTAPSQNESNSISKFTSPAFTRLNDSAERQKMNTSNTPLFGAKDVSDGGAASTAPSSSGGEFLFGTNLHQRVMGFDDASKKNNSSPAFLFGDKIGARAATSDKPSSPSLLEHRLPNSVEETKSRDFKPTGFKSSPFLFHSQFEVRPQNMQPLIKPATLPDPASKNSFDKETENLDADSSSAKSSSETSKETTSANATNRLGGFETGSISSTTASGQNESNSISKFTLPAFSGMKDNSDGATGSTTPSSSGEFLFGTNLHQRVLGLDENSKKSNNCSGFVFGENLANRVVTAERPSSPVSSDQHLANSGDEVTTPEKQCQSLEESAREYQAKHGVRPEYKEIEVKTGEENESNVLQCNCKLFVFEKPTQVWVERGCGVLRLNDLVGKDSEKFQSRIGRFLMWGRENQLPKKEHSVMRSQGSLRVILNTKIWTGMTVERASQKTVRITAADGDGVKVFLIAANPKDTDNILRAIDWRIQQLKTEEEEQMKSRSPEKRKMESQDWISPNKKLKKLPELSASISSGESKSVSKEESDSSVLDPETEASNESYTSSQTVRSESD